MEGFHSSVNRGYLGVPLTACEKTPSRLIELSFHCQDLRIERLKKVRIL